MSAPTSKPAPVEPAPAPDEAVERELEKFVGEWTPIGNSGDMRYAARRDLEPLIAASREAGRRERDAELEAARSLSRTAATAQYRIKHLERELATARAAAEQARADTERLDWLQEHPTDYDRGVPVWELGARESGRTVLEGPSVREAIDAEIHARAPREGGSAE